MKKNSHYLNNHFIEDLTLLKNNNIFVINLNHFLATFYLVNRKIFK
jgi:hypothetical protein